MKAAGRPAAYHHMEAIHISLRLSAITKKLQAKLPTWFKMRKDPRSVGAQFLNVTGLTLEEIQSILTEAASNLFIGSANVEQIDIVYKAPLPSALYGFQLEFVGDGYLLQPAPDLDTFFRGNQVVRDEGTTPELFYGNFYLIDQERHLVYVRRPYAADPEFPEGKLELKVLQGNRIVVRETLSLRMHHVWNYFDEWGLLLDTPRLYGETNAEFKDRLLSVFQFPGNSSRLGLTHGILRDLGLTRTVIWDNAGLDLTLTDARVATETITVDGAPWAEDRVSGDASGRTILRGSNLTHGLKHVVKYAYGLELLRLNDKDNTAFQSELFNLDGSASRVLKYYVNLITQQVPMKWGEWRWEEGFWDMARADLSGNGILPAFSDASIAGWRRYRQNVGEPA